MAEAESSRMQRQQQQQQSLSERIWRGGLTHNNHGMVQGVITVGCKQHTHSKLQILPTLERLNEPSCHMQA